jgi:hypothetical protein
VHVGWTGDRIPEDTDFSLLHSFETASEGHGLNVQWLKGIKRPVCEVDYSLHVASGLTP